MKVIRYISIIIVVGLMFGILWEQDSSAAKGALDMVRIVEGIDQRRPMQTSKTIGRRYVWNFRQKSYTISMQIDVERYNSYTSKDRHDIPKMVAEGVDALTELIQQFQQVTSSARAWSNADKVNFILSFVQSLPYTVDNVTTGYDEFRRYAIETLIEGGGDCEDTTILACAILSGLGYKLVLIHTPGHIAFGVPGDFSGAYFTYNNDKYYYCETTGTGWTAGKLPDGIGSQAEITPITPTPVPIHPKQVVIKSTGPTSPTPTEPRTQPTPKPKKVSQTETKGKHKAAAVAMVLLVLFLLAIPLVFVLARILKQEKPKPILQNPPQQDVEFPKRRDYDDDILSKE